jgi:hypothetical protein
MADQDVLAASLRGPTESDIAVIDTADSWDDIDLSADDAIKSLTSGVIYDLICSERLYWKLAPTNATVGDETATTGGGRVWETPPDTKEPFTFFGDTPILHHKCGAASAVIRIRKSSHP